MSVLDEAVAVVADALVGRRDWLGLPAARGYAVQCVDALAEAGLLPRVVASPEGVAELPTGAVVRLWDGDVVTVDHGPNNCWDGGLTMLHTFRGGAYILRDVDEQHYFPATVIWQPEAKA